MRLPLATLLACLLLLGAGRLLRADDEPASKPSPTIHTTLEAARAAAHEAHQLIFVSLDLMPGDDAPALTDELAAALAEHTVVARLPGALGDEAADALRVRYGFGGTSDYWFVLRPDGALVGSMKASLGLLEIVRSLYRRAVRRNKAYEVKLDALKRRTDPVALTERLDFHLDHREHERVIALCRQLLQRDGEQEVRVHGALASALGATLQRDEERQVLERMVANWPDHPERIEWRVAICETDFHPLYLRLAREGDPAGDEVRRTRPRALLALLGTLQAEKDLRGEARVRHAIGEGFCPNFMDKQAQFRFVAEHAPDTWFGEIALAQIAQHHNWLAEYPETIAAFEALLHHHPKTAGADYAKDQIARTKRLMAGEPKSLSLVVTQPDTEPGVGKDHRIVLTVGNTTDEPVERITVMLHSTGFLRYTTQARVQIESLPAGEEREVVFGIRPTAPGTIRLIAYAKGVQTYTQAKRLEIVVPKKK